MRVPAILPDELLVGYRGRLAALNNWASIAQSNREVVKNFPVAGPLAAGLTAFTHSVSLALGMSLKDLLCQHSMWPLYAAFPDLEANPDWDYCNPLFANVWVRLPRPALAICEACVADELKTHHFSYWHRSHQLPGQFHCPEHGVELRFIALKHNALLNQRPDELLLSGKAHQASDRAALAMLPVPADTLSLLQRVLRGTSTRSYSPIVQTLREYVCRFADTRVKDHAMDGMASLLQASDYRSWLEDLLPMSGGGKDQSRERGIFFGIFNQKSSSLSASAIALISRLVIPSSTERNQILFRDAHIKNHSSHHHAQLPFART